MAEFDYEVCKVMTMESMESMKLKGMILKSSNPVGVAILFFLICLSNRALAWKDTQTSAITHKLVQSKLVQSELEQSKLVQSKLVQTEKTKCTDSKRTDASAAPSAALRSFLENYHLSNLVVHPGSNGFAARRALIDNMKLLKDHDATIVLQGVPQDQSLLDEYILGDQKEMPAELSRHLDWLENQEREHRASLHQEETLRHQKENLEQIPFMFDGYEALAQGFSMYHLRQTILEKKYGLRALIEAARQNRVRIITSSAG